MHDAQMRKLLSGGGSPPFPAFAVRGSRGEGVQVLDGFPVGDCDDCGAGSCGGGGEGGEGGGFSDYCHWRRFSGYGVWIWLGRRPCLMAQLVKGRLRWGELTT